MTDIEQDSKTTGGEGLRATLRECWRDLRLRRGLVPDEEEPVEVGRDPNATSLTDEHRRRMEEMFRTPLS